MRRKIIKHHVLSLSNKYSLYHLIGHISHSTLKKLIYDHELTVYDFLYDTPKLSEKISSQKAMITKIKTILKTISLEQLTQLDVKHLAVTGLSEHNIKLLQSININYVDLGNFTLLEFTELTNGNSRESTYFRIMQAYKDFEVLISSENKTINSEREIDKEVLLNSYLNTLEPGTFFTTNQILQVQPLLDKEDLLLFLKKGLLFNEGIWYRKKYKDLKMHIHTISNMKYIDVLYGRLEGKSLQELATEQNVSRQSISNREKAILKMITFTEEEAKHKKFFENFFFSKELFCDLFEEHDSIYNFLNMRLQKGTKDVLENIDDYPFTDQQRMTILQHYKGIITHKNQLATLSKLIIFEDVLFYHGRNTTNDDMLFQKYNEYIIKNNYPIELAMESSELRGLHERSNYALQDKGHNYRYYDVNQLDENEIDQLKALLVLSPGIYNMHKIYSENLDFMKAIDIRNENELHNLYKRFIPVENVVFNRMPEFAVGKVEKRDFIIHLFFEQAPIHIDDFIDYVHDVYHLRKNSLKSYIQMNLFEYISDEIIQVEYHTVTDDDVAYLQSILISDIHTIDEIVALGSEKLKDFSDRFINNMILNKLGYSIRGQYILTNEYKSVERYFTDTILKKDYFINERLPVHRTQSFWKTIYDLEKNLDIFKIEQDMYITLTKLEQVGISKSMIIDFQNQVKAYAKGNLYFSLALLQRNGFTHKLLNLGFESIFYDRILWADSEIKTITLAAGYIFTVQEEDVSLVDFLKWLVNEYESIDAYDLMDYIHQKYNITIDVQKTITLLQNTDVYYSPELSKFYCDKDTYFEEIYN